MKCCTTHSRYTDEQLLQQLKNYYIKYKKVPTCSQHRTDELATGDTFWRRFGSWNNALMLANIPIENKTPTKPIHTTCTQCTKNIKITRSIIDRSKTKRFFCSQSCAASYNNCHKNFCVRRSKLEQYIETKLLSDMSDVNVIFNDKTAINYELDIFVPSLKLAFELNGPVHYKPIFGEETFQRTLNNDRIKRERCKDKNIQLIIIDTSKHSFVKDVTCEPFYQYVKSIVLLNLQKIIE